MSMTVFLWNDDEEFLDSDTDDDKLEVVPEPGAQFCNSDAEFFISDRLFLSSPWLDLKSGLVRLVRLLPDRLLK